MATTAEPARRTVRFEVAPKTLIWLLLLAGAVWVVLKLTAVLTVITVALVLVGTLSPAVSWLEGRGVRRGRALTLVFLLLALALTGVVLLTVPPLVSQCISLIENAPAARDRFVADIAEHRLAAPIVNVAKSLPLQDLAARAGTTALGYSTVLLELIGYGISTLFLAIYLLADPTRSVALVYACVPRQHHVKLARILIELRMIVGGYVRGQLITSAAIATFVFLYLLMLGVENALPLALFAGLTDVIPFVGGYIASAPVIIAVLGHSTTIIVVTCVLMVVYQEFESRILVPRVYGRTLRLQPAIVLVALLVGGTLMGILGALLALPIAAGLQMLLRELRVDLPGEAVAHDEERERDREIAQQYEQLADGATALDAAQIAGELAHADAATAKAETEEHETAPAPVTRGPSPSTQRR